MRRPNRRFGYQKRPTKSQIAGFFGVAVMPRQKRRMIRDVDKK
jgi:hypothetical protein